MTATLRGTLSDVEQHGRICMQHTLLIPVLIVSADVVGCELMHQAKLQHVTTTVSDQTDKHAQSHVLTINVTLVCWLQGPAWVCLQCMHG